VEERLGERIRRRRIEKKLGLREAAAKLKISATYLSRIETSEEKNPPAEDVLRDIAALLDDSFDELMSLAGRVPSDVRDYITQVASVPQFLRTAREQNLTDKDFQRLMEQIKKGKK
jgi:HTH-type transcriptional regulator, competence development regulator